VSRGAVVKRAAVEPVRLFVSYSHLNRTWFQMLRPLLRFRQNTTLAHVWHDQELTAGVRWDKDIRQELDAMDVFLCLVSHHFHDSDYIMDVELKRAKQRRAKDEIEVVPVLLEPMNLEHDIPFLHEHNPLPAFGKPWNSFNPRSNAFMLIRDGVRDAIERVRARA